MLLNDCLLKFTFFVPLRDCILYIIKYRRHVLEKKLADAEVTEEEQSNLLKYLEKKETEYMRIQRHKMGADDFEPLTMIGKGAFGEVTSYKRFVFCMCYWQYNVNTYGKSMLV